MRSGLVEMSVKDVTKLYDSLKGKRVRIHTNSDTIEGIWEDHSCSLDEINNNVHLWWVQLNNGSSMFYILATIAVIEVII